MEPSLTMKRGRGRPSKNKDKNRKIKDKIQKIEKNERKNRPKKSSKKCFMCNFKRYPFNQNGQGGKFDPILCLVSYCFNFQV